ncbi:MAG: transcription elongation factor GreA [Lachnospiraceae bacterium]|nr:transcription elongation factor GreA [Lachnospiraceae bacterium]
MYDKLTKSDIKKMEEEIEYRKLVVRPKAVEDVREAAAQGDRSENFEYYAAKKFNRQNNSRINYLENMIKTATIIDDESKEDEVGLNNTVTVEFVGQNMTKKFKIVTTVRADSLSGMITNESPLGKALLHHKVGDVCHVKANDSVSYDVKIIALENTDDAGDEIRSY